MAHTWADRLTLEQRATLALWVVPGIGPRVLEALRALGGGRLEPLAQAPVREWLAAARLPVPVRRHLAAVPELSLLAEQVLERCAAAGMRVAFTGERAYPARLAEVADAPPLLFY